MLIVSNFALRIKYHNTMVINLQKGQKIDIDYQNNSWIRLDPNEGTGHDFDLVKRRTKTHTKDTDNFRCMFVC
jgi:hypothetical protein